MDCVIQIQLTTRGIANLFICVLTSALWHGLYQFTSPSLAMSCASLCLLNLIFFSMPNCRQTIRLASAVYKDGFLILFKLNRFANEIAALQDPSRSTKNPDPVISSELSFLFASANVFYLHVYVIVRYIIFIGCRRFRECDDNNNDSDVSCDSHFDDGVCAICMSGPQESPSRPDCGHTFCYGCLSRWSRIRMECPLCSRRFASFRVFASKGQIQGNKGIRVQGPDFLVDDYPVMEMNLDVISGWFWGLWAIYKSTCLFVLDLVAVFNWMSPVTFACYHSVQAFRALATFYLNLLS
jgi:hypothetical protein